MQLHHAVLWHRSISGDVVLAANPSLNLLYQKMVTRQGPRSNFEIEGGGGGKAGVLPLGLDIGGVQDYLFLLTLCNSKKYWGGGGRHCTWPAPRSLLDCTFYYNIVN